MPFNCLHVRPALGAGTLQDKAWREQQKRLLSAQFGPKEVDRLAMNEMVLLPGDEDNPTGGGRCTLGWGRKHVRRGTKALCVGAGNRAQSLIRGMVCPRETLPPSDLPG